LSKGEIGGDDDRGALVEAADEMKEQLAAGLGEGEIAEVVEDDEVEAGEMIGDVSIGAGLGLELTPGEREALLQLGADVERAWHAEGRP
jgi:hypothetical protein